MRTFSTIGLWMLVALVGLMACTAQPSSPTQHIVTPLSPTPTPLQEEPPAPTATPSPGVPPIPFEPVGVGTPLPTSLEPITLDNVDRLVEIARWGKGYAGSAAWSSDGRQLIIPAGHGIYFYDADTGAETRYLPIVKWADYAKKTATLTLLSDDIIFDLRFDDQVLFDGATVVQAIPFPQGKWLAVILVDGPGTHEEVPILDVETGEWLTALQVPSPVEIAFSSDGKYLAVGTRCEYILVWEVVGPGPRLEPFAQYLAPGIEPDNSWCDTPVETITFSPDNQWLAATVASDGMVWPVAKGTHHPSLVLEGDYDGHFLAGTVAFSPDSQRVVFGGDDGILRGWDLTQQTRFRDQPLGSEHYWITALRFTPEGILMVGTLTSGVLAWDMQEARMLGYWTKYSSAVQDLRVFPADGRVLVKHENSVIEIIALDQADPLVTITDHLGPIYTDDRIDYAPEGDRLALSIDDTIYILNSTTGQVETTLVGDGPDASYIALSPDGRLLAAGYSGGALRIWDVESGSVVRTLVEEPQVGFAWAPKVAFAPDGTLLASTLTVPTLTDEKQIVLWNPITGEKVRTIVLGSDVLAGDIGFSPDGAFFFYTELYTDAIYLYDTTQWQEVMTLFSDAWNLEPGGAAFLTDSRKIAIANVDSSAAFDVENQSLLWISDLGGFLFACSPDATLLLMGDYATLVKADTGEVLRPLHYASINAFSAFFSPDSTRIYIVGGDGIVRVWGIPR